jgi:hypothetical protein
MFVRERYCSRDSSSSQEVEMVMEMPNSSTSQETRLGNGTEDGDSLLNKVIEGKWPFSLLLILFKN